MCKNENTCFCYLKGCLCFLIYSFLTSFCFLFGNTECFFLIQPPHASIIKGPQNTLINFKRGIRQMCREAPEDEPSVTLQE